MGVSGHVDLIFCTIKNKATGSKGDWRVKFKKIKQKYEPILGKREAQLTRKCMKGTR